MNLSTGESLRSSSHLIAGKREAGSCSGQLQTPGKKKERRVETEDRRKEQIGVMRPFITKQTSRGSTRGKGERGKSVFPKARTPGTWTRGGVPPDSCL